jgi:hypothetical protein
MINQDPELVAMSQTFDALKSLNSVQVKRIIHWVKDRFGLVDGQASTPAEVIPAAPKVVTKVEVPSAAAPATAATPAPAAPAAPATSKPPHQRDLLDYDTVLELFAEATVKKVSGKILLMAAYLQERHNFKEISSYDINFRLKRIGHGVQNISSSINSILKRKPQLMVEIEKEGSAKQSRRKFKVTVEGLKVARSYFRGAEKKDKA